jgi:hypothetical protein
MKPGRSMLFLAATLVFCATVITSAQSQQASSSTVKLGDKVIVIPNPEGFEEASSQFENIRRVLATMQLPHSDTLLLHMPMSDCERLRTGSHPQFHHYTKVSVLKSRREVTSSNADLAGFVTEWRKNGAIMFDPDGPLLTSMTERLSRQISEAASKQITYDVNETQNLGEFDVRPDVYSRMIFLMYTKDVKGTKSMSAGVASMTFLKVGPRIINVGVYHNFSSPAAVKTELKPTVIEVKQFTTKWVNEILAANREKQ